MKTARWIKTFLRNLFVGSAVAGRATASLPAPQVEDAVIKTRWDEVRRETDELALKEQLPPEVLQFLPDIGDFELDTPTAIRLSYAAAEPRDFRILDSFWEGRTELKESPGAAQAFAETRRWLAATPATEEPAAGTEVLLARLGSITPRTSATDYTALPDLWEIDSENSRRHRNNGNNGNNGHGGGDDDDDGGYDDD